MRLPWTETERTNFLPEAERAKFIRGALLLRRNLLPVPLVLVEEVATSLLSNSLAGPAVLADLIGASAGSVTVVPASSALARAAPASCEAFRISSCESIFFLARNASTS